MSITNRTLEDGVKVWAGEEGGTEFVAAELSTEHGQLRSAYAYHEDMTVPAEFAHGASDQREAAMAFLEHVAVSDVRYSRDFIQQHGIEVYRAQLEKGEANAH